MASVPAPEHPVWLLAGVLVAVMWLSAIGSLVWWIGRDTGAGAVRLLGWIVAVVLVPVGPLYHFSRRARGRRPESDPALPDRTDRILASWVTAFIAAVVLAATFSPPDPFSQVRWLLVALLGTVPAAYTVVYRGGYRHLGTALGL